MNRIFTILLLLLLLPTFRASASHIVGGEVTYKYLGDTIEGLIRYNRYEITVIIYQDCQNGQLEAIQQDNPAFLGIFDGTTRIVKMDTGRNGIPAEMPPFTVPPNFSNSCVTNVPKTCLIRRTFRRVYKLIPNTTGYIAAYQRCCRNNGIVNILSPGDNGSTYYCTIPPSPATNNSAVFKNYPPQIICINNPLYYDHSATDADGDSLSYEFCDAYTGANESDIKPPPKAPPYTAVTYLAPFSALNPLTGFPPIQINPTTGQISGTPNRMGRYLVTVCCNEWRQGVLINTTKREFQFVVTDCSKVVVADIPQYSTDPNTYIVNCEDYDVRFVNNSKGGFSYHWDFGVPEVQSDTSALEAPSYTYPDTGTFLVTLVVNPESTCPDSISRFVKVYPKFRANFEDSGSLCPGKSIAFKDLSSATIRPITSWEWNFGDGTKSIEQNPAHVFQFGGTYNVVLISKNIKNCVDTILKELIIQNFKPYAGDDTVIVKGESIHFDAVGGITYTWSPATNLDNPFISDPTGYFPDTGTYTHLVYVESAYGCAGTDTINVTVVNQASFFVPNAFSPNGDGLNDIFRVRAIGYRSLRYFRIYNRWGEVVYKSEILEDGWNGTYKNKTADLGVYFWEVGYIDRFGKEGLLRGDVTLVR